jgi:hypothetical protein
MVSLVERFMMFMVGSIGRINRSADIPVGMVVEE